MKLIDLHADTITALYYADIASKEQEFILDKPVYNLDKNPKQIDLAKLRNADSLAQFFVLWLNMQNCQKYNISAWDLFIKQYNVLRDQLNKYSSQIDFVTNLNELDAARENNKLAGFACVEEGAFITDLGQLQQVHAMGIRYITIVWNYETHIATPAAIDQTVGLKPFGFEMVQEMQRLGIMVDVSHLSDQGVRDVLSVTKKPIIASHSNARSVCNHRRNLTDDLIVQIASRGGVIGVNCVPQFLRDDGVTIYADNVVKHIQHIYNLAGIDVIAIGNDFDGFNPKTPELDEIKNIADMPILIDKLQKSGFSLSQIEKMFSLNALRVMKDLF